ncbi:MAG: hypothetical protein OXD31_06060, partial [Chloroflexi bacterium]|nr:hypothetical protein [Chloroflexota bacterium]
PEITEDMRTSIRRMMHSELVMERLIEIAKGEAPDTSESSEVAEPETEPDESADTESSEAKSD